MLGSTGISAVSGCQTLTWPVRFPAGWQGRATVGNLVPAEPGGVRLLNPMTGGGEPVLDEIPLSPRVFRHA